MLRLCVLAFVLLPAFALAAPDDEAVPPVVTEHVDASRPEGFAEREVTVVLAVTVDAQGHVTAASALTHSIHQPGVYSGSLPVSPNAEWRRNAARFARLDATLRKLLRLNRPVDPAAE